MLKTYKDTLGDLIKARKTYKVELIDRFKLLGCPIVVGNNAVPEFTQITNYLNLIKVLPTAELNKMIETMKIYLSMK